MAGSKSNYLENEILDHILGGQDLPYSPPANIYVGLHTGMNALGDAGNDDPIFVASEVISGASNYSRVQVANDSAHWAPATNGVKSNSQTIQFPTASGNWTSLTETGLFIRYAGLYDAPAGGNLLFWADLQVPKPVTQDDTLSIPAGGLVVTED